MKKLLSIKYSPATFNAAMLLLRIGVCILVIHHGYDKLVHYSTLRHSFMNFMGIGSAVSLALVIFAEFFCALFIAIGLFTRLACIPIIIVMSVALFKAYNAEIFGKGELSAVFLTCFIFILLVGPGRASIDGMVGK